MRCAFAKFGALTAISALTLAGPAFPASPDVERATQILKDSRGDQCQRQQLRGQILLAHQAHDQPQLDALGPQLEAINHRLKATEDQLKALKAVIRKNSDDQNAFETAQLELADCE
jgi:hypothetical protein